MPISTFGPFERKPNRIRPYQAVNKNRKKLFLNYDANRDFISQKVTLQSNENKNLHDKQIYDYPEESMFVQITSGKSFKKSDTPSPKKGHVSESQSESEDETSIKKPEIEAMPEEEVPNSPIKKPVKNEQFFHKMSEKANKYLPNKKSFGKMFKEKENPDINIYTIDKDMARSKTTETLCQSELTDRLRQTKQPSPVETGQRCRSIGSLATPYPPYRLLFLPPDDWKDPDSLPMSISRIIFCQCTLACFLLLWLIFGALSFYLSESSYEHQKILELEKKENSLILSLATDLRLIDPDGPAWKTTIEKYTMLHKNLLLESNYGKQKIFWTFSGSLMFSISLLTTLGLAAPLPTTFTGNILAFIFVIFGAPVHFIFLSHLGKTIALKMQIFSKELENKVSNLRKRIINVRRFGEDLKSEEVWPEKMFLIDFKPPSWLKYFPLISMSVYYLFGVLLFGLARDLSFPKILFFPLEFADLTCETSELSKISYGWYLEGAAILTSLNIVILRDSPINGWSSWAIKFGFMTNSLD